MTSDLLADALANRTDRRHRNILYELNFEYIDGVDEGILLCPQCGGNYLHHETIETFDRKEDAKEGIHTIITHDRVDVKYGSLVGNPSLRRDGFKVKFGCEFCGNSLTLEVSQHKGQTFMGWDVPEPEKPTENTQPTPLEITAFEATQGAAVELFTSLLQRFKDAECKINKLSTALEIHTPPPHQNTYILDIKLVISDLTTVLAAITDLMAEEFGDEESSYIMGIVDQVEAAERVTNTRPDYSELAERIYIAQFNTENIDPPPDLLNTADVMEFAAVQGFIRDAECRICMLSAETKQHIFSLERHNHARRLPVQLKRILNDLRAITADLSTAQGGLIVQMAQIGDKEAIRSLKAIVHTEIQNTRRG